MAPNALLCTKKGSIAQLRSESLSVPAIYAQVMRNIFRQKNYLTGEWNVPALKWFLKKVCSVAKKDIQAEQLIPWAPGSFRARVYANHFLFFAHAADL